MKNDMASKKRSKKNSIEIDESEAAFHFIAFVPIDGKVWKLDGLERQPQKLCNVECENWIRQVKPDIMARMARYEEGQIEFSILSLVREPLSELTLSLAQNVKSLNLLSERLDVLQADGKDFAANGKGQPADLTVVGPEPELGLTQQMIDQSSYLSFVEESISSDVPSVLIELQQKLLTAQAGLRASIKEEQQAIFSDQERATSRRFDYGPAIHEIIHLLSRKQMIESLLG